MNIVDGNWKTFMARATVLSAMLGIVVFGAVRLASARDGVPGSARTWVTFAGVVSGIPGDPRMATMRFSFHRVGDGVPVLCAPTVRDVSISSTGAFSAQIPLDATSSSCPNDIFDGRDVQIDVEVNGDVVVRNAPVNPVPYAHFASVAGQYGTPDCPVGYERNRADVPDDLVLCQKQVTAGVIDQIVRVGTGASAFWIDRFEATVWPNRDGSLPAAPYGCAIPYPAEFRSNGQWRTDVVRVNPVRALSRAGFDPSSCLTWFQANEACRAAGKRLPTGSEWLSAAQGTPDPGTGDLCRIGASAGGTRGTAVTGCVSAWGVQDMIGNVWEWTDDWFAGAHTDTTRDGLTPSSSPPSWPSDPMNLYGNDGTWNVGGAVVTGGSTRAVLPAAGLRGGSYQNVGSSGNSGAWFPRLVGALELSAQRSDSEARAA